MPSPPTDAPDARVLTAVTGHPSVAAVTGIHLHRITVNYARHRLTGYDRASSRLAGRVGHQDAHQILRAEVNAAIEAKLSVCAFT